MGITGLLPFLEKASKRSHLSEFRGYTVAIDTYCWLHKGAFACADKLARGENTDVHIQYCLKYINLLLSYNIKPILVFDGRHLAAKELTETKRREIRKNAKKRAVELLRLGKTDEARSHLRRCVDITHAMALCLIKECRKRNIDCIVAPYEADAQLAFLNTQNIAQIVITEDSDLTLFGCTKILFKLDLQGNGVMVDNKKFHLAMGIRLERYTFDKFRYMCILSGCDYIESLPGIGLMKACKFIKLTEDPDIYRALLRIPGYLNMKNLLVSDEYRDGFMKADATFRHMLVYDPVNRKVQPLTDPVEADTKAEFCCNAGDELDSDTAFQLALGNLDPFTMKRLDDWHPDANHNFSNNNSIWSKHFVAKVPQPPPDVRKVCFPTTFGKGASIDTTKLIKSVSKRTCEESEDSNCINVADLSEMYLSKNTEKSNHVNIEIEESKSPVKIIANHNSSDSEITNESRSDSPVTPNKTRNPFAKNLHCSTEIASPDKLFEQNPEITSPIFKMNLSKRTSLIKSITSPKKGEKRKRLSKFDITCVPDDINVVSRFFKSEGSADKISTENKSIEDKEVFVEQVECMSKYSRSKKTHKLEKSHSVNLPVFHTSFSNSQKAQIFQGLIKSDKDLLIDQSKIVVGEFKNPVKSMDYEKSDEMLGISVSTTSYSGSNGRDSPEVEIIMTEESTSLSQPLARMVMPSKLTQKKSNNKTSCRKPGLTKTKSVSNLNSQSRLSMFGFKKREQMS